MKTPLPPSVHRELFQAASKRHSFIPLEDFHVTEDEEIELNDDFVPFGSGVTLVERNRKRCDSYEAHSADTKMVSKSLSPS